MGKYVCPYCGETDNFIINTENIEEFNIVYDKQVRCGNCYKIFTDKLYQEFADAGKLGTRDTKHISQRRRRFSSLSCFTPFEVSQARRARCIFDESASWRYKESFKKHPCNWEAVFFSEYYSVISRSPAENIALFQSFVNKLHYALHLAESSLSGEELRIAVTEIFSESMNMVILFWRQYKEASEACLSGQYPALCRSLFSMDVSAIYETIYYFVVRDQELYKDIISDLQEQSDILDVFGLAKKDFIVKVQLQYKHESYRYPCDVFRGREPLIDTLKQIL